MDDSQTIYSYIRALCIFVLGKSAQALKHASHLYYGIKAKQVSELHD